MRATNLLVFVFLFVATEEVIGDCSSPVGMESGSIKDWQVTASSAMSDLTKPAAGRLNNQFVPAQSLGAWCASSTASHQYFQVDLLSAHNITAVATQGTDIAGGQWVTEYTVSYSCDGHVFYPHASGDSPTIFQGNNNSDSVVTNSLASSKPARFLRINPTAWNSLGSICLRVEVYGCPVQQDCPYPTVKQTSIARPTRAPIQSFTTRGNQVTEVPTANHSTPACHNALGMQSGAIKDSQISASSHMSMLTLSSASRLHHRSRGKSLGAWCAQESDTSPHLQVDLLRVTVVSAVGTQGIVETDNWVTHYSLSYSCDGKTWSAFAENGKRKIFRGNRDSRHVATNKLHVPLTTRYIRIRPLAVSPFGRFCLRAEFYGCAGSNQAVCSAGNVSDVPTTTDSPSEPAANASGPYPSNSSPTSAKAPVATDGGPSQIIVIVVDEPDVVNFLSKAGRIPRRPLVVGIIMSLSLLFRNIL